MHGWVKNEVDLAWAAGLFDGEGTIFTWQPKGRKQVRLDMSLSMCDEIPVQRFQKIVGGKVYRYKSKSAKRKKVYRCDFTRTQDVYRVFYLLKPYLSEPKIAQGEEAIKKRIKYCEEMIVRKRRGYRKLV